MNPASTGALPSYGIGIATRGRAAILRETLADVTGLTIPPVRTIVCGVTKDDIPDDLPVSVTAIFAAAGLPRQRNAILSHMHDCEVLLFLDDDFLPAPGYAAEMLAAFADPDVVVGTGEPIADDVKGPGLSVAAARKLIAEDHLSPAGVIPAPHGYGCNMAVRVSTVLRHGLRFDERLPLYGWSEDVDFSHRLGRYGRIVKTRGARGVHLGAKSGRTPGRKLGYSQVANPLYLFGQGSYSFSRAMRSVGRNVAANAARSLRPEPFIDRRGRLRGNIGALLDLLAGRLTPERMLDQ